MSLCKHPFNSLVTFNSGETKMCCESVGMGSLHHSRAEHIWNSETWRKVRREFLAGQKPLECAACWRDEARSGHSSRERIGFEDPVLALCASDGTMASRPKRLSIRLGNECNLKCIMCGPINSSKWREDADIASQFGLGPRHEDMVEPVPILKDEWLDEALNDAEWIQFIGGEPLIIKKHRLILEALISRGKAGKISLSYSTNLSFCLGGVWTFGRISKKIWVNASIDGIGDTYEMVRYPQKWPRVEENLLALESMGSINYELNLTPVVMSVNALEISELFRWRNSKLWKKPPAILLSYVDDPDFLAAHHMAEEQKEIFRREMNRVAREECVNDLERKMIADVISRVNEPRDESQSGRLKNYLNVLAERRAR